MRGLSGIEQMGIEKTGMPIDDTDLPWDLPPSVKEYMDDINKQHETSISQQLKEAAIREPVECRYDLLMPEFLRCMAMIMYSGSLTHKDAHYFEYEGNASPVNHMLKHLMEYQLGEKYYDRNGILNAGLQVCHLGAIACNAMMEFAIQWRKLGKTDAWLQNALKPYCCTGKAE